MLLVRYGAAGLLLLHVLFFSKTPSGARDGQTGATETERPCREARAELTALRRARGRVAQAAVERQRRRADRPATRSFPFPLSFLKTGFADIAGMAPGVSVVLCSTRSGWRQPGRAAKTSRTTCGAERSVRSIWGIVRSGRAGSGSMQVILFRKFLYNSLGLPKSDNTYRV